MDEKEHKLNPIGACTCGIPFCRRWRENFPKVGEEKRCKTCYRTLTIRENTDGSSVLWCVFCTLTNTVY